ncbi:hypothetical protein D3C72_2424270 [compost metagenome]
MFQQPGVLGRGLGGRQSRQVGKDIVRLRNLQRLLDRRKIVHGDGQGAVHVEHPVANLLQAHCQSLR